MKLITLSETASFVVTRSTGDFRMNFQAYTPYVMSNAGFASIYPSIEKKIFKASYYDFRLPGFDANHADKSVPVLYFNGSGGFGDHIMSWPVVNILNRLGFKVHVAADHGLETCWWHLPFVESVVSMPMQQAQLEMWKHKILLDAVVNFDEHPDQIHPVDTQLRKFGINPDSIDPELKAIPPLMTQGEREKAATLCADTRKLGIYQLSSTSPTRSMSPERSLDILASLARRFPHVRWLAIYDQFVDKDLVQKAGSTSHKNIVTMNFTELRVLWATVMKADLCIGPDSMLVHIAGSAGIPTIGLWGPIHPRNRVRYYKNHTPIWHQNACQFSPCFVSTHEFPHYCPPLPEPRKMCAVLGQIGSDEVCVAASKFLA